MFHLISISLAETTESIADCAKRLVVVKESHDDDGGDGGGGNKKIANSLMIMTI